MIVDLRLVAECAGSGSVPLVVDPPSRLVLAAAAIGSDRLGGRLVITLYLNCAKVWTRLVRGVYRLTGRDAVTYEAPPLPAKALTARRSSR